MAKLKKTKQTTHDTEASTSNGGGGAEDSFYSMDLSGIDTSFPLLREDEYPCEFASYKVEPSKDGSIRFGHFTFKTTASGRDPQGLPVAAGYTLHKRVNLTTSADRTPEMVLKDLARIVSDGFGRKSVSDLRVGDPVLVTVKNSKSRTDEKTGRTYEPASEPRKFARIK